MDGWMHRLAKAYAACRATHPEDRALLVLDLGGTIFDAHAIAGGDGVGGLSSPEAVLAAHRPYRGVLDVARWFGWQPLTAVAISSARPEAERAAIRRCLDVLGQEYRLTFPDDLVQLRPADAAGGIIAHKVENLRRWRDRGFRVVAVIDSDPQVVDALAGDEGLADAVCLPTRALLEARRAPPEPGPRDDTPRHVELVWHGANDLVNLRQFLALPIRWGEVDVRLDPEGQLVVRHEDFDGVAPDDDRDFPTPHAIVETFRDAGKGLNLDFKDPEATAPALKVVAEAGFPHEDLRLNGRVDKLGESGLRAIAAAHPEASVQCPAEFLGPLAAAMPDDAHRVVETIQDWGVDRFSVAWTHPHAQLILTVLDGWGVDVNLYGVTDLPQFLGATLSLPRSVTADFTLPEWHYFGRGAGNDGRFHRHQRDAAVPPGIDMPR